MRSILFLLSPLLLAWTTTGQQGPNGPPRMGQGSQNEPIRAGEITYQSGRITCTLGSVIGNEIFDMGSCHLFLYVNKKLKANSRSNAISYKYKMPIRAEVMCRAQCSNNYYERNNIETETLIIQEGPFIGLLVGIAVALLLILAVIVFIVLRRDKKYKALDKEPGQAPPLPVKKQQSVVALPTEEERAAEKERQIEQPDEPSYNEKEKDELEEDAAPPPLPEKTRSPPGFSMKQLEEAVGDRNKDESEGSSSDWDNTNAASYYPATATTHRYAEVTSEI